MRPARLQRCGARSASPTLCLLFAVASAGCDSEPPRLPGFSEESAGRQGAIESRILGLPSGERMQEYHEPLTEEPHHAGTPANERAAEAIAEHLRDFGFDSILYSRYEVLLPRPLERSLSVVFPDTVALRLEEPPLPEDEDTAKPGVLPTFNAYSADGDVTAEVVYVNYGLPADYRTLDSLGISVAGKIVLARYGGSWRGIKPRLAAERGAVGALIYSDPADDGFAQGPVMPDGKWRPEHGVQRGSVLDLPRRPGDPQTPGRPSLPGAERLPLEEVETLLAIPVQPISYGDARPILERIGGRQAPEAWVGGLPIEYRVGPGPAVVHLQLRFDWSVRPIVNVIGLLRGAEEPDHWVMAGGHRDAWTFGGRDPISGTVSMLETARALATVHRRTPFRRTVAVASWDAEEYGLIGSTEFAEEMAAVLPGRVVTYINRESYTAGAFEAAGSHALQPLVNDVARRIVFPGSEDEQTVYESWRTAADDAHTVNHGGWTDVRLGALGSGSDYTAFLDHLGIPSLDVGFSSPNGIYHSRYDTHWFFTRYGDPGFETGERLAELVALVMARLANADVLPLDYTATAETVERYLEELQAEVDARRLKLDLGGVRTANDRLAFAAAGFNAAVDRVLGMADVPPEGYDALVSDLNDILLGVEQDFLHPEGLPRRPWFRHLLYAPGYDTGYGVKTLPGIREAVERGAQPEAREMATALEAALLRAVDRLSGGLERAKGFGGDDD